MEGADATVTLCCVLLQCGGPRKHGDVQGPLVPPGSWEAGCLHTGAATKHVKEVVPGGWGLPHTCPLSRPLGRPGSSPEGLVPDSAGAGGLTEPTQGHSFSKHPFPPQVPAQRGRATPELQEHRIGSFLLRCPSLG